jgi:mycothiol system anti-sigma-R factor
MSCGSPDNSDTNCDDVLLRIYQYLDGEMGEVDCEKIRQHLEDCQPCLKEYDLDQALKALIRRSCRCETAPETLRTQIMARITTVTVTTRVERAE